MLAVLKGLLLDCAACLDGGIGRHAGLKIPFLHRSAGSIPAPGTTFLVLFVPFPAECHHSKSKQYKWNAEDLACCEIEESFV